MGVGGSMSRSVMFLGFN